MANKKYEFTGETIKYCDYVLRRIRALRDISLVAKTGNLGGWIESEKSLSHEGDCWVGDGCYVCGGAKVYEDAHIMGCSKVLSGSKVYGNAYVGNYSHVIKDSKVYGYATVTGSSLVSDSEVYDHATIAGSSIVAGHAKVFDAAVVDHGARVCGKAVLHKYAKVSGDVILDDGDIDSRSDFICVGPIGSRDAYTTYNLKTGTVCTGCFRGTLQEFEERVIAVHGAVDGGDKHYKPYMNLIEYFKTFPLHTTEPEED